MCVRAECLGLWRVTTCVSKTGTTHPVVQGSHWETAQESEEGVIFTYGEL